MKITMKQLDAKIEHLNYLTGCIYIHGKFAVQKNGTSYRLVFYRHRCGEPLPVSPVVGTMQELYNIVDTITTMMLIDEQNGWE